MNNNDLPKWRSSRSLMRSVLGRIMLAAALVVAGQARTGGRCANEHSIP
ncbi:hypothetical protein [Pseudohongiella sp. O18]|nr:hypothetical protein [Pseudohongiella sp. O18]